MTTSDISKLLAAIDAANIESYHVITDMSTRMKHDGKHYINKLVGEVLYNFMSSKINVGSTPAYDGGIQVTAANLVDIHEFRTAGSYEQIKLFADSVGISFTDDEIKILLDIDKRDYDIKPETGDYVSGFHYLTQKQYDELKPAEKTEYDEKKAAYEKAQHDYIGQNMAASVRLG